MIRSSYEIFSEAARQENFQKAASALNLTRSAVSHSISSLEEQWGFPLFIREKNGIRLTEEGKQILPAVRELLQQEELVQEKAAGLLGRTLGKICLAAFSSVCSAWMPDLIHKIHLLYPELEVSLMQGEYEDVCEWVRTGVADIGLESIPFASDLVEIPLAKDEIVCVTPEAFVPENGECVSPEEIGRQHLILWHSGRNTDTMRYINRYNIPVGSRYFLKDDSVILTMIAAGEGIGLFPRLALPQGRTGLRVWPLKFPAERTIGILLRSRETLTPSAKKILQLIKDEYGSL